VEVAIQRHVAFSLESGCAVMTPVAFS